MRDFQVAGAVAEYRYRYDPDTGDLFLIKDDRRTPQRYGGYDRRGTYGILANLPAEYLEWLPDS